jgi:AAA family ATP:ADP antiporter
MLLVSIAFIELGVWCVIALGRHARRPQEEPERGTQADHGDAVIGGSMWAGLTHVLRSPYLLGIALFMLLYTVSSTFLYFQQAEIINANFIDTDRRTAVFASIDLAVNTLTLLTQAFLTGRIMRWLGVGATLALLPAVSVAGFLTLGFAPVIAAFVVFQVMRRASNFALARPTREVLYTVVAREDRFKAKSFLDTFVYRGGDQVGAWSYAGLSAAGLGVAGVSFVAVPLCGIWLLVALWLGRRQERMRAAQQPPVLAVAREDAENARPG